MTYSKENIFEGTLHFEVLEVLHDENKSYGTQIARRLEKDQSLISEILYALENVNLVKKSERTKAQTFVLTEKGLQYIEHWIIINEIQRDVAGGAMRG